MQTYAEIDLINAAAAELKKKPGSRILNIGSSGSLAVEKTLDKQGCDFVVDHLDVDPRPVNFYRMDKTFVESAENMKSIGSESYALCFSNFVWEHIPNADAATREAFRVTEPGGLFVFTVPNPLAPEFLTIRLMPLWMRRWIKNKEIWPTFYAYKTIRLLKQRCLSAGFKEVQLRMQPAVYSYTYRFPILSALGRLYDGMLRLFRLDGLMGHAVLVCRK